MELLQRLLSFPTLKESLALRHTAPGREPPATFLMTSEDTPLSNCKDSNLQVPPTPRCLAFE